jgi:hypothetical protein
MDAIELLEGRNKKEIYCTSCGHSDTIVSINSISEEKVILLSYLNGFIEGWKQKIEQANRLQDLEFENEIDRQMIHDLRIDRNLLIREINHLKSRTLNYNNLPLPENFGSFIQEIKLIGNVELALERDQNQFIIWIAYGDEFDLDKYFDIFCQFIDDNVEYDFETKIALSIDHLVRFEKL